MYLVFSGEIVFHLCGISDKQCACLGCWELPFQCGRRVVCQLWTYLMLIWRECLWSNFICLFFQQEKALHLSHKSLIGHGDEFHDHSFGDVIWYHIFNCNWVATRWQ